MTDWLLPSADMVEMIHDTVLNQGELTGMARDKSLSGALARVENRLAYGMIDNVFALAAAYAMAISQGHCFNDANKRTAYRVMQIVLDMNGAAEPDVTEDVMGQKIIALAQGKIDDGDLADWLRGHP
ncbi:type II toxin-antitoxin system death-on-curing family toxin [Paracoccus sp. SCSIO 75233]|uniref:type II toxin-antitoxin system death-on-curing family toxin n=1 Tax=Paracoccus sp. SCSIO 75233 TaxID=3017782 RepID=UPI0022F13E25|nr:type II toxin-antitoxin system death-on-curing family toxin [Paracoccus sp. SCSIO 75233]WBU52182.1 type II toxin-antitoxin system death-on-curing family toxin [Paracoccus sp. SCSIO 75233]